MGVDVNLEESSSVLTEGGSDDQRDSTDSASFSIQSLEFSDGLPAAGSSLDIEDGLSSSCPAPGVESFPVSTDVPSLKEDEAPEAAGEGLPLMLKGLSSNLFSASLESKTLLCSACRGRRFSRDRFSSSS